MERRRTRSQSASIDKEDNKLSADSSHLDTTISSSSSSSSSSLIHFNKPELRRQQSWIGHSLKRAITCVMVGCCINNFALEKLVRADPGIGNLITVCQFIFIACMGLFEHLTFSPTIALKPLHAPIKFYAKNTLIFLTISVINNVVFLFNITLPFHMIFRSCSLVASMVIGMLCFNQHYSKQQIIACVFITSGVLAATMADSVSKISNAFNGECCNETIPTATHMDDPQDSMYTHFSAWCFGVALLCVSLILSALLGHIQQAGFRSFGKHAEENMFYSHVMSLPFFVLIASDLQKHMNILITLPAAYSITLNDTVVFDISYLMLLLINLISQYICVLGVYNITCLSTSLTCTFTITVRKFISLIFSVWWFSNPFTVWHCIGSSLVFSGTLLYATSSPPLPPPSPPPSSSLRKKTD